MIKRNDMMSVKDVQEMLGIPLLGAIPEDEQVNYGWLFFLLVSWLLVIPLSHPCPPILSSQ